MEIRIEDLKFAAGPPLSLKPNSQSAWASYRLVKKESDEVESTAVVLSIAVKTLHKFVLNRYEKT